ncbi:TIGR04551 family protein [Myxococcota bacterium]|nr:TIGR04551 family protein [Myxococcota bacterium]MBU1432829.1 TIGR04551 family protein [Myxococcota bacterium]MBU1897545.1 TIGR04551 family protein [Myxococcota bacterium]
MRRWLVLLALLPALAHAEDPWGLGALRDPFLSEDPALAPRVTWGGYFRLRGDVFNNLDLNRGPTPSTGGTIFPLPAYDPRGGDQLTSGDIRLRLEPHIQLGWEVNVRATIDLLDRAVLGANPAADNAFSGMNAASTGQRSGGDSVRATRAWAEIGTPIGLLTAGRMGVHWGMGLLAHAGDELDSDQGNTVDMIGLAMPLLYHIIGVSYELSATGPTISPWEGIGQDIDADPSDDVRSISLALLSINTPAIREIKRRDGRPALDYGLVYAYRWQDKDDPQGAGERAIDRGFSAHVFDAFLTFEAKHNTLAFEGAVMRATIQDASLIPGLSTDRIEALQYGGVLRDTYQMTQASAISFEIGLASGDDAPGFGARPGRARAISRPGDMDGPQLKLPDDLRVDNFRFHPDYHVDLILWRTLVGTVTDALYLRPKLQLGPWDGFTLETAAIWSRALEATTPPGQQADLGVEVDLQLRYQSPDRFVTSLEYGYLVPLAGLDNPTLGLQAEGAWRLHALMGVLF